MRTEIWVDLCLEVIANILLLQFVTGFSTQRTVCCYKYGYKYIMNYSTMFFSVLMGKVIQKRFVLIMM